MTNQFASSFNIGGTSGSLGTHTSQSNRGSGAGGIV